MTSKNGSLLGFGIKFCKNEFTYSTRLAGETVTKLWELYGLVEYKEN